MWYFNKEIWVRIFFDSRLVNYLKRGYLNWDLEIEDLVSVVLNF